MCGPGIVDDRIRNLGAAQCAHRKDFTHACIA
jgi:hypothetical protein